MYYGQHTQTGDIAFKCHNPYDALDLAEELGWEDGETELMEIVRRGYVGTAAIRAEFPCHYYGDYTCELTSNRPDSLCPFHAGEED